MFITGTGEPHQSAMFRLYSPDRIILNDNSISDDFFCILERVFRALIKFNVKSNDEWKLVKKYLPTVHPHVFPSLGHVLFAQGYAASLWDLYPPAHHYSLLPWWSSIDRVLKGPIPSGHCFNSQTWARAHDISQCSVRNLCFMVLGLLQTLKVILYHWGTRKRVVIKKQNWMVK